jgi:hypothetical protein
LTEPAINLAGFFIGMVSVVTRGTPDDRKSSALEN